MKLKMLLVWITCIGLIGINVQKTAAFDFDRHRPIQYRMHNLQLEVKNNIELARTFICPYPSSSPRLYRAERKIAHYYLRGEYQQALSSAKDALVWRMNSLGKNAPETICAMRNLGVIYLVLGHLDEALVLCENAYHLGFHNAVKLSKKHPGLVLPEPGDILLEIYKRKVGSAEKFLELFATNKVLPYNFIRTYKMSGRTNEALLLHVKAYRLWKEILGQKHFYTSHTIREIWKTVPISTLPRFEEVSRLRQEVLDLEKGNPDIYSDRQKVFNRLLSVLLDASESFYLDFEQELELTQPQYKLSFLYEKLQLAKNEPSENFFNFVLEKLAYFYAAEMGNVEFLPLSLEKRLSVFGFEYGPSEKKLLHEAMKAFTDFRNEALGEQHLNTLIKLDNSAEIDKILDVFLDDDAFAKIKEEISTECMSERYFFDCIEDDWRKFRFEEGLNEWFAHHVQLKEGVAKVMSMVLSYSIAMKYQQVGHLDEALLFYENVYRSAKEIENQWPEVVSLLPVLQLWIKEFIQPTRTQLEQVKTIIKKIQKDLPTQIEGSLTTFVANGLAGIYRELGRLDDALPLYEKSYHHYLGRLGEQNHNTITSLNNLAYIYVEMGRINDAINSFEKLVESVETQRRYLSVENRQTFFKLWAHNYFNLSWLYLYTKQPNEAFRLAEMAKARTLLESITIKLAAQQVNLRPEEQQQLQDYQNQIAALNHQIAAIESKLTDRLSLESERGQLHLQFQEFNKTLRQKYPRYAKLTQIDFIQAQQGAKLIPSDGLFISYLMLDNHVLIFTLDSTGDLQTIDLGEIAGLEQTLKTYQQLLGEKCTIKQLRNKRYLKPRPRCELFDKERPKLLYVWQLGDGRFVMTEKKPSPDKKPKKKIGNLDKISRYLGQQLLAPIKDRLHSKPRWIISPDGMLAQIPFETLILEEQPVIAQHEISYVQSLSVLALLKEREKAYQSLKGRKTLLAMGAPRYHLPGNRPKVCNQPTRAPDFAIERMLARNANDPQRYKKAFKAKEVKWCNLPGAEKELAALETLFADQQPLIYKQADASEANLQRLNREQELTRYRYLVFSAHGYFDAQTPELSVIVLDQLEKTPDTDGFITASEWPSYDFKSDLMVLSACQTGQGKVLRGEGVLGLPYAFYVAGNKNTLMTLWTVRDESTAEFTARFFEKLKGGMNQVKALTETKREFLNSDKYKRALFWAPFVLYGI